MSGLVPRQPRLCAGLRFDALLRHLSVTGEHLPMRYDLPEGFSARRHVLELDAGIAPMFKRREPDLAP